MKVYIYMQPFDIKKKKKPVLYLRGQSGSTFWRAYICLPDGAGPSIVEVPIAVEIERHHSFRVLPIAVGIERYFDWNQYTVGWPALST